MTTLASTGSTTALDARVDIESIDHVVLTVRDAQATIGFYADVLGMRHESRDGRDALHFGSQKLNLHVAGSEREPRAAHAAPGSADLCLLVRTPIEGVMRLLDSRGVAIEHGPVERDGATGRLLSVYLRDPDGNLIELANRLED